MARAPRTQTHATTLTSREFNQDTGRAKRAALTGPVYITDRGTPAHVLLSYTAYRELVSRDLTIVDRLAAPAADATIDFDPPRIDDLPSAATFD